LQATHQEPVDLTIPVLERNAATFVLEGWSGPCPGNDWMFEYEPSEKRHWQKLRTFVSCVYSSIWRKSRTLQAFLPLADLLCAVVVEPHH